MGFLHRRDGASSKGFSKKQLNRIARLERLEPRQLFAAITWANSTGHTNWNDPASWVGGVVPGAGDSAVFPSAATIVTPRLSADAAILGVSIDNSQADYSLTNSGGPWTLTLGAGGLTVNSPGSTAASTTTVNPILSASANLTLTASNNTGVTTLNFAGAFNTNSFRVASAGSGDINVNGVASGSGGFDPAGLGSFKLAGTNTFTGGVTASSGTLLLSKPLSAGTGTLSIGATSGSASVLVGASGGFANPIVVRAGSTGTRTIEVRNTSGTATFSGPVTLNSHFTIQKGAATGGGLFVVSGGVTGTGDLTLSNAGTGGSFTVQTGDLNHTGAIINAGSGTNPVSISSVIGANVTGIQQNSATSTLTLRNNSPAFTGATTINSGTLSLTPAASGYLSMLGSGTALLGATSGSAPATLSLGAADVSNALTVRSGGTGTRSLNFGASSGTAYFRGVISLQTDLMIAHPGTGGGASNVTGGITGSGNLTLDHDGTSTFSINTNAINPTGTITSVGTGTAATTIAGGIGNNVSALIQSGTSPITVSTTALSRGSNFSIQSNSAGNITISAPVNASSAGTKVLTHTGSGTGLLTISGAVSNGSGLIALTQNSATSNLVLTGTHTYTGATTVSAGTLFVNGVTNVGSAVTVNGTGTLAGTGTVNGPITLNGGSAPGAAGATGKLNTGHITFNSGSSFTGQINTNVLGTGYDNLNVVGTVTLNAPTLNLSGTLTTSPGQTITLITNDGTDAVTGWFAGLPQNSTVTVNGVVYRISYVGGTGNDVVLTDLGNVSPLNNFSHYGVAPSNSSISQWVVSNVSTRFDTWGPLIAAQDIKWVRTYYNSSSSAPGVYDFTKWDHTLAVAASSGVQLSAGFSGAPSFMNTAGGFPTGATALGQWYTYVYDVVTHTAGQVKHWEVWNEPPNFTNGTGTPAQYAALVQTTYDAVKAADPTAQVGLTAASSHILWLAESIEAGAANHFDYITLHPYEVSATLRTNPFEANFMSVVPTVRKMLADLSPAQVNAPVWFTEIGTPISGSVTADIQAQELVKYYTMGIAQGAHRINWFEPLDGDSGAFGLFNNSYVIRQSGTALSQMIDYLGNTPNYLGWVQLNGQDYGFVFEGATTNLLITWAPPGVTDTVNFGQAVTIVNPLTGATSSASSYSLTNTPIIVVGAPASIVTQAKANKNLPIDWDGDYTGATSIDLTMGNPNIENGLHQLSPVANSIVTIDGAPARDAGLAAAQNFVIDPNFLSYTNESITITAVVRRYATNGSAGFNLWYESTNDTTPENGFKNIGWFTIPSGATQWHTMTFTLNDAQFVGKWGKSFWFNSDSTANSKYYIKSVTVTKNSALRVAKTASAQPIVATPPPTKLVSFSSTKISLDDDDALKDLKSK